MTLNGHCLCGATTFTVDVDVKDVTVGADHCDACQRQTGSAYSLVAVVPRDKLSIKGAVKEYRKPGDSGKDVARVFCGECGSPVAHLPDAAKDIAAVKAGCFEKSIKKQLKIDLDIYAQDKLACVTQTAPKVFNGMPEH